MLIVVVWVCVPLVPDTVIVFVNRVCCAFVVVSVNTEVDVVDAGENEAENPRGSTFVDRATVPAKPPSGVIVTVNVAVSFECMVADDGATLIAKSGVWFADCTMSVAETEWVSAPLVPVIVNGYEPAASVLVVEIVSVEDDVLESVAGLKPAPASLGRPLADSETEPPNPPVRVRETV